MLSVPESRFSQFLSRSRWVSLRGATVRVDIGRGNEKNAA